MLLAARACHNTFLFHCSFELLAGTISMAFVQSGQKTNAATPNMIQECLADNLSVSNTQYEA
jgi:hypothetical protein